MPSIFLLDTSASLGRPATATQSRKEVVQSVVLHFLKFLEEQHPTEPVGLVILAPAGSQPLSVGLTRDYGELSKALYSIELAREDGTDLGAGLTEALRQLHLRFGAELAPTQIFFITESNQRTSAALSSIDDIVLPGAIKLHIVALSEGLRSADGNGELVKKYRKLAQRQGGDFHLVEPSHIKQAFDALARNNYAMYDGQLTLGHISRRITLFPNPNMSHFQHAAVHNELPRTFPTILPLIGFISAAKMASPPSLSIHAVIPLPSHASISQGLNLSEDDLSLCLMLNACLKNDKKIGVVQLDKRWFGLISSTNENGSDYLVLSVLSPKLPVYDFLAWTEELLPTLNPSSAPPFSPYSCSFPIKKQSHHPKSYAIGKGVYSIPSVSQDLLQGDLQKILRFVGQLPQKKDLLFAECQKIRSTAQTYQFPDLVERLGTLLEEELGGIKEKEAVLILRDLIHQLRNNASNEPLSPRESYQSGGSSKSGGASAKKSAMSLANLLN